MKVRSSLLCLLPLFLLVKSTAAAAVVDVYAFNSTGVVKCKEDYECGKHGSCAQPHVGSSISVCVCESPYINIVDGTVSYPCAYKGVSRLNAMFTSFIGGFFGADWFLMANGSSNPSYILCGLMKLCTFGGYGVWWLYDFLRLISGGFSDGNGMPLFADL